MELTRAEVYFILNLPSPLWLSCIDLSRADLIFVRLPKTNLLKANLS